MVKSKKLETGLRPNSAGIPYTLLLRMGAIGFPTFGLLLYCNIDALIITYIIPEGSLLYLYYTGAQNPIGIVKAPTLGSRI